MLDFDNEKNAVYIASYPFPEINADKMQGMKVLEEASECREAYDQLAKISIMSQDPEEEEIDEEVERLYVEEFVNEACDCIQSVVNLLAAVFGVEGTQRAINEGMYNITVKNAERGYYGEEDEEEGEELSDDGTEA